MDTGHPWDLLLLGRVSVFCASRGVGPLHLRAKCTGLMCRKLPRSPFNFGKWSVMVPIFPGIDKLILIVFLRSFWLEDYPLIHLKDPASISLTFSSVFSADFCFRSFAVCGGFICSFPGSFSRSFNG